MNLEDKIKGLLESEEQQVASEEVKQEEVQESKTEEVVEQKADIAEHMNALFEGAELSEEFKKKTELIFEAAVQEVADARVAALEEQFKEQVDEAVNQLTDELVEQIDGFLDQVVEQWMEDNAVAVENGLRSEIVGNFINGLKDLFAEHYIDVPEEKVDVLGEQATEIESLQSEVNKLMEANIELQKANKDMAREIVIENVCYDLTQVEKEKVKALAENVEMVSEEEFVEKVKALKESYIKKQAAPIQEGVQLDNTPVQPTVQLSEAMAAYTRAISSGAKF